MTFTIDPFVLGFILGWVLGVAFIIAIAMIMYRGQKEDIGEKDDGEQVLPGARISFTLSTSEDADIIAWLDSFGVRERGFAIKASIRDMIEGDVVQSEPDVDRLSRIEDQVSNIFREIVALRKEGLALSINNDIMNTDLPNGQIDPEVESNIGNLLEED